ncbi:MAG: shikimate kinase [Candidatus Eiseniibacteriota bacterium]
MIARIALIGLSGAGKTTVAPLLAERLGFRWMDLDTLVEKGVGTTVGRYIETAGEPAFRERESDALRETLTGAAEGPGLVLACGAGALGGDENRRLLREAAFTVWLSIHPDQAARRLEGAEAALRPLLGGGPAAERLNALLMERGSLYRAAADATVETDRKTPEEVATAIAGILRDRRTWEPSGS